jgi:hypothetical protein
MGVDVAAGYAYVADWGDLLVIDVSVPSMPVLVGTGDTAAAGDVVVSGQYAYVDLQDSRSSTCRARRTGCRRLLDTPGYMRASRRPESMRLS